MCTVCVYMVTGRAVEEGDQEPISLEGGSIEVVNEFQYLGSLIAITGRMDSDVSRRLAQASKAFGALRKTVFMDKHSHSHQKISKEEFSRILIGNTISPIK